MKKVTLPNPKTVLVEDEARLSSISIDVSGAEPRMSFRIEKGGEVDGQWRVSDAVSVSLPRTIRIGGNRVPQGIDASILAPLKNLEDKILRWAVQENIIEGTIEEQ